MQFKNVSQIEMQKALDVVNRKYGDNVQFGRLDNKGKTIIATLRVISAKKGAKGRKLNQSWLIYGNGIKSNGSACWHVHGDFFEALLNINPKAIILSMLSKIFINENGMTVGNWQDRNIGSMINPIMYSGACECNDNINETELKITELKTAQVKTVSQNKLSSECWTVQIWGLTKCETCDLKGKN